MRTSLVAAALAIAASAVIACHPPASPDEAIAVAKGAPQVGAPAPAGTVHDAAGAQLAFGDVWRAHPKTVLVFYRGFY